MSCMNSALLLIVTLTSSFGLAEETRVSNARFGFNVTIPDGFSPAQSADAVTLYSYLDRDPATEGPAWAIQIQRLEGTISVGSRLKESEMPRTPGLKATLQELTWKGHTLDVIRQETTEAPAYVVFGIQYPLSGEAVQLQVGGPIADEAGIYERFCEVASSFDNTVPLVIGTPAKLTSSERQNKFVSGLIRMAITVVVIALIVRAVFAGMRRRRERLDHVQNPDPGRRFD